jgi:hypothetical protein
VQSEPQDEAAVALTAPASIDIRYILKSQQNANKKQKLRRFVPFNKVRYFEKSM